VTSPAPIAPRPTRAAPIATTSDAGRPKWDYRPDGWQEPSDPVLAAPSSSATPAGADAGP
jgi:hypothetical protein